MRVILPALLLLFPVLSAASAEARGEIIMPPLAPTPIDPTVVPPTPSTAPGSFGVREIAAAEAQVSSGKGTVRTIDGRPPAYVRATWRNAYNATRARLYSAASPSGPWLQVWTATVSPSTWTQIDVPTARDTRTCWLAESEDALGNRTRAPWQCWSTRDGKNRELWRAQLTVSIGNVSDAGTDSNISAGINSRSASFGPWGSNYMWLETPADDFEAGSTRTYELRTQYVSDVSDVNMIILDNTDSDQVCVSSVTLKLNEVTAFARNYSPCLWVRQGAPLFVDHDELRASTQWQSMLPPSKPIVMSYDRLDSYVTMMVAQQIVGTDTSFNEGEPYGGAPVSGRVRSYGYDFWGDYYIPASLYFNLRTSEYCSSDNRAIGVVEVTDVDVDGDPLLWLVPIMQVLVEYGNDVSFDSTTEVDLGECVDGAPGLKLCMRPDGVGLSTSCE